MHKALLEVALRLWVRCLPWAVCCTGTIWLILPMVGLRAATALLCLWRKKPGPWRVVVVQICRDKYKTSFTALPLTQCSSGLPRNFFNMQSYLRICFFSLWESLGSLTSLLRKRPKCTYTYCHNFFLFIDPRWGPLLWSLKQWFLTLVVSQNLPWSLLEMQISCLFHLSLSPTIPTESAGPWACVCFLEAPQWFW